MGLCSRTSFSNSQENKRHRCSPSHLSHTSVIVNESLTNYKRLPQFISQVGFFFPLVAEKIKTESALAQKSTLQTPENRMRLGPRGVP